MSYNYAALRSTTPPLYYQRPEGVPPSYYCVHDPKVETLHVPRTSFSTPQHGAAVSYAAAPGAPRSSISNPFPPTLTTAANPPPTPSDSVRSYDSVAQYVQQQQQQQQRWAAPAAHGVSLDAEEATLAAETASLRARLGDLQAARARRTEELLAINRGWAALAEREDRYNAETVPDLGPETAAREGRCAELRERLEAARAHLQTLERRRDELSAVLTERESLLQETQRVQEGLTGVERRRRACVLRAERFFDAEAKRASESRRHVRRLENELKLMTASGPLAELQLSRQGSQAPSRAGSRGVTFAENPKSIVFGSDGDSIEPEDEEGRDGLSTANNTADSDASTRHSQAGNKRDGPLIGDDDDFGGHSVLVSLSDISTKRPRFEVSAV